MNTFPPAAAPGKRALVIVGMHRSGTSATTGALRCLGVQLGPKLYSGHADINAKGYFEHSDIADANEEALLALGSAWDDILLKPAGWWENPLLTTHATRIRRYIRRDFGRSALWALKDPRVCRLLPWWLAMLAAEGVKPYFLFVVRDPEAVYRSLEKRDGFSREKAYLLWSLHYLEAEHWSRGHPRTFMDFDAFLDAPLDQFNRAEHALDLEFPVSPRNAAPCLEQFLSKDLRHHRGATGEADDPPAVALGRDLHRALLAATSGDSGPDSGALDGLEARMAALQAAFPPLLTAHLADLAAHRGRAQLTLERLVRSWSWYTGKPVRYLERLLGRDV